MKEEFLHYVWKYKLYNKDSIKDQNRDKIEILNPGSHNSDSGPDFFNAKIKINETVWAGNVEIHINSSDWYAHNHHKDKAYDNVILQIVYNHNKEITRTNGKLIPTLEIKFDQGLLDNYESLIKRETWISCQNEIKDIDPFMLQNWLEKLSVERLEEKAERIKSILEQTNNSWENAFYIQLARNFGFKLNSDPFELLAKSLPLNYLAKHKDNLFQIEALLFGQAGFLNDDSGDEYYESLKKEYLYLQKKFKLIPIEKHLWKFLRSRPGNFPTVRIAQFAQLIHRSSSLFSKLLEIKTIKDCYDLLIVNPSDYWENHYILNKDSIKKSKAIGKSAVDILLINTIIPFLFIYGKVKGLQDLQERAISLLENIKPEKNAIITKWNDLGVKTENAFNTQALIQLKNKYCDLKKMLKLPNWELSNSKKHMKAARLGKENIRSMYVAITLLLLVIIIGTVGFVLIERFTFAEALFMTIITISTVGFREVHPLSGLGQFFTAFLIVISFGIFAYAVTTFTKYIVDGVLRNYLKDNKVKSKIEKLSNHVIVVGYGRNGNQAIKELIRHKFPVVVIDSDDAIIEKIREDVNLLYIQGDATQDETLLDAKIEKAQALITALPKDADNLFVVLTAKTMNPEMKIISRASNFNSDRKLRSAGATNVIMPDKIGGQRMAKLVAQPDIVDFIEFIMLRESEEAHIEEISCENMSEKFTEKSIGEWSIRTTTGANIIGLKTSDNNYVVNPSADVKISNKDQIFVLGSPEQIGKLKKVLLQS